MRKLKIRVVAFIALLALCMSLAACDANTKKWALADRSLGTPSVAPHPFLVTSAVQIEPGWEFARKGDWYTDQRQIPDYPAYGGAVVSIYERLGISNGRPRDHVHWSTYSHHGLAPR